MTSKKASSKQKSATAGFTHLKTAGHIEEYELASNKLRVLYLHRPDTGVVTTNITYKVGARDEARGETGVAHMLEHMLFKPTKRDLEQKIEAGGAMQFERNTGAILNANTWKDRTTYYFSYPVEYFSEALAIEADRMHGVILTDEALQPEQNNVLSEFDMYNGDPHFALSVQMCSTAFHSHPYGHETIGYREDIEDYTAEKLERFYRNYYRPDNATLMIIGDIARDDALAEVKRLFEGLTNPNTAILRHAVRESKQEGLRRVTVERPSTTNIVSLGFLHDGLPSQGWFVTGVMLAVLAQGPESILQRLLVDTGRSASVDGSQEPTSERNLGMINISLAPSQSHTEIETLALEAIRNVDLATITPLVKKVKAQILTEELFGRTKSLHIAQELTEYVSAGDWTAYTKTPDILQAITPKQVLACIKESFTSTSMTIGHFIGTLK